MSPAHALAHAVADHGRVVRHWALDCDAIGAAEIAAAWGNVVACAHLFAAEQDLSVEQMYAVVDAVVNASAVTYTATLTTERNRR